MIKDKLRELGFSEKETGVYLALLAIGSAVASDIAKRAGIKRSTAYVILDALLERGLVSALDRRGVRMYHAAPAEQLVRHMKDMASRYEGFADVAKELLPALNASRRTEPERAPAPKVQFFQGAKGIKTVYEDTLSSLEDIRVHAAFVHDAPTATYDAHKKPMVSMRLVTPDAAAGGKKASVSSREILRKAVSADREDADASSEINVYDDRVVFISSAENFAVVIESKELASAFKKTFSAPEKESARHRPALGGLSPAFG